MADRWPENVDIELAPTSTPPNFQRSPSTRRVGHNQSKSIREEHIQEVSQIKRTRTSELATLVASYSVTDDAPAWIEVLRSTPAREITSTFHLAQVTMDTPIVDVLKELLKCEVVLVRNHTEANRDLLWARSTVLDFAMKAGGFGLPISTIADQIPHIPMVDSETTIDSILDTMILTGSEQLGTLDKSGAFTGIITYHETYRFLLSAIYQDRDMTEQDVHSKQRFQNVAEKDEIVVEKVMRGGNTVYSGFKQVRQRYETTEPGRVQKMAQEWVEAAWTEFLILTLVLLDIGCTIWELVIADDLGEGVQNPTNIVTGTVLLVFLFEASVRIFGYRQSLLWRWLDLVDLLLVFTSIIVWALVLDENTDTDKGVQNVVLWSRVMRFLRILKIARNLRKTILASRTRYNKDGFSLDLGYVTPTCIAMALPAIGAEANVLNRIEEVQRFFSDKHGVHYLIFNCCAERDYDKRLFGGRVESLSIDNHNPPMLDQLISFLEHAASFMDKDPSNVIAVHSKLGRGRTGVLVCSWLIHSTFCASAVEAMEWFGASRTASKVSYDNHTVSTASQVRYVTYIEEVCRKGGYQMAGVVLKRIRLFTCPRVDLGNGCNLWYTVEEGGTQVFPQGTAESPARRVERSEGTITFEDFCGEITGDVRVTFYDRESATKSQIVFYVIINTAFLPLSPTRKGEFSVTFRKDQVDLARSDVRHRVFDPGFKVELTFEENEVTRARQHNFRTLVPPSNAVLEASQKHRGVLIDSSKVGMMSSRRTDSGIGRRLSTMRDTSSGPGGVSYTPMLRSLCPAPGILVNHETVSLYAYTGGEVHGHKMSKKLMNSYKRGSEDQGAKGLLGMVKTAAKHAVSGNKRRFQEDGFDLDLSYITPRLIAMGFPSEGVEGVYRNSQEHVYKFFQQRHSDHYRIINLCSERQYNLDMFHGSVARYPFPDHNPPPMELILPCCQHMHTFLQKDTDNVVAVHCKAGKGRTGLMLVCYLMFGGLTSTALDARAFYDQVRTFDGKGLTIISQIRYAHYFEALLKRISTGRDESFQESTSPAIVLYKVVMTPPPLKSEDAPHILSISVIEEENAQAVKLYRSQGIVAENGKWECVIETDSNLDLSMKWASEGEDSRRRMMEQGAFDVGTPPSMDSPKSLDAPASPPPPQPSSGASPGRVSFLRQENVETRRSSAPGAPRGGVMKAIASSLRKASSGIPPASEGGSTRYLGAEGLRLAGDIRMEMAAKTFFGTDRIFSFQIHSGFMEETPSSMGGTAVPLTDEECAAEGVPRGCVSLVFSKPEIDQAARDRNHVHFAEKFKVTLIFKALPGECGTGDMLAEGVRDLVRKGKGQTRPPYSEREAYRRELERLQNDGQPPIHFERFVLSSNFEERFQRVMSSGDSLFETTSEDAFDAVGSPAHLAAGVPRPRHVASLLDRAADRPPPRAGNLRAQTFAGSLSQLQGGNIKQIATLGVSLGQLGGQEVPAGAGIPWDYNEVGGRGGVGGGAEVDGAAKVAGEWEVDMVAKVDGAGGGGEAALLAAGYAQVGDAKPVGELGFLTPRQTRSDSAEHPPAPIPPLLPSTRDILGTPRIEDASALGPQAPATTPVRPGSPGVAGRVLVPVVLIPNRRAAPGQG